MQLIDMFFDEIEDAKKRKVPFIIPIGTIEYHAHHASCGTDTMVINGVMRELEKEKEIVVCPPIWYGVASYAVGGPETGTIQVDEDAYTNYLYCILKSMIYGGVKNIYCVAHHQTEEAGLMPMTIACHKAAKKVTMEYMEDTMGRGWWGSNSYADYYENLGGNDDPFSWIKVIPAMSPAAQKATGYDRAAASTTRASGKRPSCWARTPTTSTSAAATAIPNGSPRAPSRPARSWDIIWSAARSSGCARRSYERGKACDLRPARQTEAGEDRGI